MELTEGRESFAALRKSDGIYIDKTAYLKDLMMRRADKPGEGGGKRAVTLFTRPRRFGKTLTLSMIESFFALNYQNPGDNSKAQKLFEGLAISEDKEFCRLHLGQYPVVNVSLKSVEGQDFASATGSLLGLMGNLYRSFDFLLQQEQLDTYSKDYIDYLISLSQVRDYDNWFLTHRNDAVLKLKSSLSELTRMLEKTFHRKVIVLVDEYDVPLQKAKAGGYYDEMLDIIRGMFGNVFKTNDSLLMGIVTGCLRISRESIFTGINNFSVFSVFTYRFRGFIGFTKEETVKLLKDLGLSAHEKTVMDWYEGYNFSGLSMLCPWSVLMFCAQDADSPEQFTPQNFWANTSGNDIIEICMRRKNAQDSERLQHLLDGGTELIDFPDYNTYPELDEHSSFDIMLGMMLHTGYLTAVNVIDNKEVEVKIPNKEALGCFEKKARFLFGKENPQWLSAAYSLKDALFMGDTAQVQSVINTLLINFVSVRDYGYESFYHGFLLGVLSITADSSLHLASNQESGKGFSDITLSHKLNKRAVIIELKKMSPDDEADTLCAAALKQIEECRYAYPFEQKGYEIFKYGIAFLGKECLVAKA